MRIVLGIVALLGALTVLALGASLALIESEEVVVLRTRDAGGEMHAVRLWITDFEGDEYVAPGNRSNEWFQRLHGDPRVELKRGDHTSCRVATIVEAPEAIPVLEVTLEKYASVFAATSVLNVLLEPEGDETPPVTVRLDPCEAEGSS